MPAGTSPPSVAALAAAQWGVGAGVAAAAEGLEVREVEGGAAVGEGDAVVDAESVRRAASDAGVAVAVARGCARLLPAACGADVLGHERRSPAHWQGSGDTSGAVLWVPAGTSAATSARRGYCTWWMSVHVRHALVDVPAHHPEKLLAVDERLER